MGFAFRRYSASDDDQVVALHSRVFGRDPALQDAYLRWKYDENPRSPRRRFLLACRDGEIVATYASFAQEWRLGEAGGQPRMAGLSEIVIAPEHRGRGLLDELARAYDEMAIEDGLTHLLSLSAAPATYVVCRRTGWSDLGMLPTVARAPRSGSSLRSRLRAAVKAHPRVAKGIARLRRLKQRAPEPGLEPPDEGVFLPPDAAGGNPDVLVDDKPWPDEMARLTDELPRRGQVWQLRDARYYHWRFRDPLRRYQFLYLGRPLQGFLVLGANYDGVQIVEFEARSYDVGRALLAAAVERVRHATLRAWVPAAATNRSALLAEHQFEPVDGETLDGRARQALLCKPLDAAAPLPTLEQWELHMACSDSF